jgi:hypothetical protein
LRDPKFSTGFQLLRITQPMPLRKAIAQGGCGENIGEREFQNFSEIAESRAHRATPGITSTFFNTKDLLFAFTSPNMLVTLRSGR